MPRCRTTAHGPMSMCMPAPPTRWLCRSSSVNRPSLRLTSVDVERHRPGDRAGCRGRRARARRVSPGRASARAATARRSSRITPALATSWRSRPRSTSVQSPGAPPPMLSAGSTRMTGPRTPRKITRQDVVDIVLLRRAGRAQIPGDRGKTRERRIGRRIVRRHGAERDAGVVHVGERETRDDADRPDRRIALRLPRRLLQRAHRQVRGRGAGRREDQRHLTEAHARPPFRERAGQQVRRPARRSRGCRCAGTRGSRRARPRARTSLASGWRADRTTPNSGSAPAPGIARMRRSSSPSASGASVVTIAPCRPRKMPSRPSAAPGGAPRSNSRPERLEHGVIDDAGRRGRVVGGRDDAPALGARRPRGSRRCPSRRRRGRGSPSPRRTRKSRRAACASSTKQCVS